MRSILSNVGLLCGDHICSYTCMVLESIVARAESNPTGIKDVFLAVGGRVFCITP